MAEPGTVRSGGAAGGTTPSPGDRDALDPTDAPGDAVAAVDALDAAAAGATPGAVVDVRVALPMPTWTRVVAAVVAIAAAVAGTVAVFRTDNGVGSAALLLVAVFLAITAVDGQFPRLKIGDNEVMSNLTRAYRETKGKAERATARAADAQGNSEDVMDGLADAQARIAHLERLAGVHGAIAVPGASPEEGGSPPPAATTSERARPATGGATPGSGPHAPTGGTATSGTATGAAPGRPDDVSFDLDLGVEAPTPDDQAPTTPSPALLDLAERYRSLRWTMPSGPARTRAMTAVADEMRRGSADLDAAPLLGSDDIGLRLLAAVALYEHPRPEAVADLARQVMTDRKPFNEYWSLMALRRGLRGRCDLLTDDVREWLEQRVGQVSHDASRANLVRQILRDCP